MASKTSLNIDKDKAYIISGVIALSTLSVLAAVILFDHSFDKQEIHCNTALCADVISISSVSFGILSIGNPIAVGVVSFSRWGGLGVPLPVCTLRLHTPPSQLRCNRHHSYCPNVRVVVLPSPTNLISSDMNTVQ